MGRALRWALGPVLVGLIACKPPEGTADGTDAAPTDTTEPTDTNEPTDTTPPTPTTPTGDTGPTGLVYDCDALPLSPKSFQLMPNARGYHDVDFDDLGNAIGQNSFGDLVKVDYVGTVQVFVPDIGTVQQMVWLPDGDLGVASETYGIIRVAANGSSTPINPDIRPYGLILGPDDMLYAANQDRVYRVDPTTGASTVIIPSGALPRGSPRVIAFNLDYTKLYMGTYSGSQGRIYTVDLDANLDPVTLPVEFATGVGTGAYHDSMGVDVCGYLYIADYTTSALYRVAPDGVVQTLVEGGGIFLDNQYCHGLEWGNGIGGWRDDAVYLPQPYNNNTVTEVVIGVPSRHWDLGVAINLP